MQLLSIKIPKKTKRVAGPSSLLGGKGYDHLRGHVENGLDIEGTDG